MISSRERLVLYALLTSLTALSIDALLPALRAIGTELGEAPPLSTHHIISVFILGMAVGELLLGPLSDAIGRKRALLGGLAVYLMGTIIAASAQSLETVILGRFLQGVGVSGPKIATRAMIRDHFSGDAMANVMSLMFSLFILVPMIAPALAQGLIVTLGWRSVFMAYFVIAISLGFWLGIRQPETLPKEQRIPLRLRVLGRNTGRVFSSRRVSFLIVTTGLIFGAQLLYLSTAADLFYDAYGVKDSLPIYFAGLAIGTGSASFTNARLVQRFGMVRMARAGFIGLTSISFVMLIGSYLFDRTLPLPVLLLLLFTSFFFIGILFGNLNALAMQTLGKLAGIGASLIASGSSLVSTLVAVGFGALYDGGTLYLAFGFFAASLCAMVLGELAMRSDEPEIVAAQ